MKIADEKVKDKLQEVALEELESIYKQIDNLNAEIVKLNGQAANWLEYLKDIQ